MAELCAYMTHIFLYIEIPPRYSLYESFLSPRRLPSSILTFVYGKAAARTNLFVIVKFATQTMDRCSVCLYMVGLMEAPDLDVHDLFSQISSKARGA